MAREVSVATEPPYAVRIGRGLLADVAQTPGLSGPGTRRVVLSDENVAPLYLDRLVGLQDAPRLVVAAGESSKSFAVLERVLDFLVEARLDRGSCLVALGGGVIGDLGGLAASLYMRGIALVQCPTTLLAQVDSSVGGKTAVNLGGGKNLAGTFHQPRAVLADIDTLATLSEAEYASGLGEVVKSALIDGGSLLELLERNTQPILDRDLDVLEEVVDRCVRIKADVVARDEFEGGPRKSLNLGHTFGHAIEHAAGYGRVPHGVAVATGLCLAARFSARSGVLEDAALPERLTSLLTALHLPTTIAELCASHDLELSVDDLLAGMRHDKKGSADEARLVLMRSAGDIVLDVPAETDALRAALS